MKTQEILALPIVQHNEIQGTPEWLALRTNYKTASEAQAMMSKCKSGTRTELLDFKKTGIAKEHTSFTENVIFPKGHELEALARTIIEDEIDDQLFAVTLSRGDFLASLDGRTMCDEIIFEHKQWNQAIAEEMQETNQVTEWHYWQVEQQLLVSGAEKCIFVLSDGTKENRIVVDYVSIPERRDALIAGWHQFDIDLENHVVEVFEEKPEATPIMDLPAVTFQLNGLALTSNLREYAQAAELMVEKSKQPIETDQDFSDAEMLVKKFSEAEKKIKQAQADVLGEITDIDEFTKKLSHIGELLRQARLNTDKQVKTRKTEIKHEIVKRYSDEFKAHIAEIEENMTIQMPLFDIDFGGAMKNKRTISSLHESARTHLTELKTKATQLAELMKSNLAAIPADSMFLFNDLEHIIQKDHADFLNLVKLRISEHETAQAEKAEKERLEKEAQDAAEIQTEALKETIAESTDDDIDTHELAEMVDRIETHAENQAINQADILAMREFRQTLQCLLADMPKCTSTKGDIMATKVKGYLEQAVEAINWQVD